MLLSVFCWLNHSNLFLRVKVESQSVNKPLGKIHTFHILAILGNVFVCLLTFHCHRLHLKLFIASEGQHVKRTLYKCKWVTWCVGLCLAGSLLLHLLDWVRLHKADVDEKAREVLQGESPAQHRAYWDVVLWPLILHQPLQQKPTRFWCTVFNPLILCRCRWWVLSCRAVWTRLGRFFRNRLLYSRRPEPCISSWTTCCTKCLCLMWGPHLSWSI